MEERFLQQLKKGVLELLVLQTICRGPTYGYELIAQLGSRSCRLSQLCCVTITYPPPNVNALRYSVERNSFFSTCFLLFIRFVSNLTRPCAALL